MEEKLGKRRVWKHVVTWSGNDSALDGAQNQ